MHNGDGKGKLEVVSVEEPLIVEGDAQREHIPHSHIAQRPNHRFD